MLFSHNAQLFCYAAALQFHLLKDMYTSGYGGCTFLVREVYEFLKVRADVSILDCACGTGAVGKEVRIISEELYKKTLTQCWLNAGPAL